MLKRTATTLTATLVALLSQSVAPAAEYSNEELTAMVESETLRTMDLPFLNAPTPDQSPFVTMPDGVRLAVNIYFPEGFDPAADKAPAVFEDSVYGRADDAGTTAIELYTQAGYVVVIGDARGFAASFGSQQGFNTLQQTRDEAEVIGWIAAQPWSNGQVAAIGHSVSGVFADSVTASGAPNLKAAILRASDFDEYRYNMFPGGAPNLSILSLAHELMLWHAGADCDVNIETCGQLHFMPVGGDDDFSLLQAAIREHKGNLDGDLFRSIVYRDDVIGIMSLGESAGMGRIEGIRAAAVPARLAVSWTDGMTAAGALARYEMAPDVPMEVVIGATTHAGGLAADPFATTPFTEAKPGAIEQFKGDIDFVNRVLAGEEIERSISYLVLGTETWKTTDVWPPAGVVEQQLALAPDALAMGDVTEASGSYTVDPASTSGLFNRWAAQRGKPIFYGDFASMPGIRLNFDGPVVAADQELVGAPKLCLVLSSDQTDGLVVAYLQDVAPDGRVTYLTEGLLRLIHRGADDCDGSDRSFAKADGAPAVPGEVMHVGIELLPVAALIEAGHHLRLSLAGGDAGWFETLTGDTPATWTVSFGGDAGSSLTVPMRPWGIQ